MANQFTFGVSKAGGRLRQSFNPTGTGGMTGILGVKKASLFTAGKVSPKASIGQTKSVDIKDEMPQAVTQVDQITMLSNGYKLNHGTNNARNTAVNYFAST